MITTMITTITFKGTHTSIIVCNQNYIFSLCAWILIAEDDVMLLVNGSTKISGVGILIIGLWEISNIRTESFLLPTIRYKVLFEILVFIETGYARPDPVVGDGCGEVEE